MALRACKVSDDYNANSFKKVIDKLNPDLAVDEICAFESEVRQGEHDGADNLAAVLMARLQTRCR